jgi:hypothetical protein
MGVKGFRGIGTWYNKLELAAFFMTLTEDRIEEAGLLHLLFSRDRGGRAIFRKMKYGYRKTERKAGKDNGSPAAMGEPAA